MFTKLATAIVISGLLMSAAIADQRPTPGQQAIIDRMAAAMLELHVNGLEEGLKLCRGGDPRDACRDLQNAMATWCRNYPDYKQCR